MKLKFKKLTENAIPPFKAHPSDAGFDLTCTSVDEDLAHEILTYHTGIAVELPKGTFALLCPRSSVYKYQLQLANGLGIIDEGYHGELIFKYRIVQPHFTRYSVGDKIGQLVVVPIPQMELEEVDELGESERGEGSFGSTGV